MSIKLNIFNIDGVVNFHLSFIALIKMVQNTKKGISEIDERSGKTVTQNSMIVMIHPFVLLESLLKELLKNYNKLVR